MLAFRITCESLVFISILVYSRIFYRHVIIVAISTKGKMFNFVDLAFYFAYPGGGVTQEGIYQ